MPFLVTAVPLGVLAAAAGGYWNPLIRTDSNVLALAVLAAAVVAAVLVAVLPPTAYGVLLKSPAQKPGMSAA